MMDLLMAAALLAGFGLIGLLVEWCRHQLDEEE